MNRPDQSHGHLIHNRMSDNNIHGYFVEGSHFLCADNLKVSGAVPTVIFSCNSSVWNIIMSLSCSQSCYQVNFTSSCGSSLALVYFSCGMDAELPDVRSCFVSFTKPFLMIPHFCRFLWLKKESGPACINNKIISALPFLNLSDSQPSFGDRTRPANQETWLIVWNDQ